MIYASLKDYSSDVRASAVTALASVESDDAKALAVLVPLVSNNGSSKVLGAAVRALAKYGPAASAAVPGLIRLVDKDIIRGEAMRALKAIGVRNVPDLLTLLSMGDSRIRTFACEALGNLGPEAKDAAPQLREIAPRRMARCAPPPSPR